MSHGAPASTAMPSDSRSAACRCGDSHSPSNATCGARQGNAVEWQEQGTSEPAAQPKLTLQLKLKPQPRLCHLLDIRMHQSV